MNYTKKYEQVSKAAARAKFARMANNLDRQSTVSNFECGFSTWWWGKDTENPDQEAYAIFVNTNYHSEWAIQEMYKTNCKNW